MAPLKTPSPLLYALCALALVGLGAVIGWNFEGWRMTREAPQREAIEQVVRNYLLEHPEILPEAIERLRAKEGAKQMAGIAGKLAAPFPGAVLGNPEGRKTLVEFTDFACTYCRASVADVAALTAADPDLRVVIRELPIIAPTSEEAARWGLAAAEQGRYGAFHKAMFAAGRTDPEGIEVAARAAGLDLERARRFTRDPKVEAELAANLDYARQLGINGTPAWVAGDQLLSGAIGRDALARAIERAQGS